MTIEVFISYSHKDQTFREELEIHLSNLKRQKIISSWYDGEIAPGSEWEPQIMDHLTSAQIILLLISADFIHSDFCYSIEMKQAIDRHNPGEARVIPILLRPTDWQGASFDKLQMLPTGAKAVTKWRRRDDAFADIVHGIRASINDLTTMGKTTKPSIVADTSSPGITQVEQIWNIPYQKNSLFTGREDVLKKLSEALKAGKTAALAQPQAISGLGGIGKTQTAVEYAYRFKDDYKAILWVKAETEGSINADFVTIASLLDLPEEQEQDQHKIVEAVKRWLQEHTDWLLILDNADDIAMVQGFIPLGSKGHILLTTRAHATGRIARRIEVEKMEPDEGAIFLLHRAKLFDHDTPLEAVPRSEQDTARAIVKAMDGLPLALEQAGAYIEETGCGLQGYLRLFQAQGVQFLKEHGEFPPDHPDPVSTTWSLSFKNVEQANPAAAELLRFCAFLSPDAIPEELFSKSSAELGPILEPIASNPSGLNTALRELLKYSLVHRDHETNTLSIHRLVQEVLKDQMNGETQRIWAERVVRAVSSAFPDPEYTKWNICRQYLLHAQICSDLIEQYNLLFTEAAGLLHSVGYYLWQRGEYEQVESLHQRALDIREKVLGPEHADMGNSLAHLAFFYSEQGKYEQAEPLMQRALANRERVLGADHPNMATSLNNLAALYYDQGKYEEAEPLFQRALAITERVMGADHPATAQSLHWQAYIYGTQGKYEEAEPLYRRTLKIYEKVLPPDHPTIALTLNNYASMLRKINRMTEAELLEERAWAISSKRSS
jgi:tetratricopeptide (TPR) repeat protein